MYYGLISYEGSSSKSNFRQYVDCVIQGNLVDFEAYGSVRQMVLKSVGLPVGASDFGFQLESISLSMSSRWFLKGRRRNAVRLAEAEAEGLWFPSGIHQSRIELDMFVGGLWIPS